MIRSLLVAVLLSLVAPSHWLGAQDEKKRGKIPKKAIPKFTSTDPKPWAKNVDAKALKAVTVKMNQLMRLGYSSMGGGLSLIHDSIGTREMNTTKDLKGAMVPVSLKQGKVYVFGLNQNRRLGAGFQNMAGVPAKTLYLVFQTSGVVKPNDEIPMIARMEPKDSSYSVEPNKITGITIEFSHPMETTDHGLMLVEAGKSVNLEKVPYFYSEDGKTFVLTYLLQPNTYYRLTLNSNKNIGFRRANGIPLWPTEVGFRTIKSE